MVVELGYGSAYLSFKTLKIYIVDHIYFLVWMVKTTIILDDDIYKELVKEALERYGSTRKLSKLINEKLRSTLRQALRVEGEEDKGRVRVSLGRLLPPEKIEELAEEGWGEVLGWKP